MCNENKQAILKRIIHIESKGNVNAHNLREDAVGVLQIRPIMVEELNRIAGYKKYSLQDRWDREISIQMFTDFQNKYNPTWDEEQACKKWNGGPKGMDKETTKEYYKKYLNLKK